MLMKFLLKKENKKMLVGAERIGQQVKLYTE